MSPHIFAPLSVSRYRLLLETRRHANLPAFSGSTLRGAFGHALKEAVCVVEHRDCERCSVADRCIYPYIFDTPAPPDVPMLRGQQKAPRPFILCPPPPAPARPSNQSRVIETRRLPDGSEVRLSRPDGNGRGTATNGHRLDFGLTLLGRAAEYLPYVVFAIREMARRGLGADRAPFSLIEVAAEKGSGPATPVYDAKSGRFSEGAGANESLAELVERRLSDFQSESVGLESVKLRFVTPARIEVKKDLQVGLSFELLIRSLLRRVSLLMAVHGSARLELDYRGLIERSRGVETARTDLRWVDWERWSNRQATKMKLGGFVGEIEYRGAAIGEFLPLIVAGEFLHVGTGTTFGLGRYEVEE